MNTERRILIMDWKSKIMSENFYVFETLIFNFKHCHVQMRNTRWRSWLRYCATSRKVAGSIPDGVIGRFH
jgi:hypothetical protein